MRRRKWHNSKSKPRQDLFILPYSKARAKNEAIAIVHAVLGNWNEGLVSGGPKFEDGKGSKLGSRRGGPTAFAAEF
ncbi:hypothetical protein PoMZ_10008 [Pyricularia oryzae]|uniref:Uncharacterized protein n=1 Tax=Pyricularia oryzae TaxID=318829 RepID=A0A4P7MZ13_PYROR|nr:hypothetical protein PoMZ_10008 [Pyricularia oryzae]